MRRYEISPAVIAEMRRRVLAAPSRETGVSLALELLRRGAFDAAYVEAEAGDVGVDGLLVDGDEDDDFY